VGGNSPISQTPAAADVLRRQHTNLEQRLQPFWAQVLPERTVRLQLFASPRISSSTPTHTQSSEEQYPQDPLCSQDVVTAADGSFKFFFRVTSTVLSQHPGARHITLGDQSKEHELHLCALLLPPPASTSSSPTFSPVNAQSLSIYSPKQSPSSSPVPSTIEIPLSHSLVRVISDIDDTIKSSEIFLGVRMAFRNLFTKDLQENVIPGMSEWYNKMWTRGVRFHYVVGYFPSRVRVRVPVGTADRLVLVK
jgi:hypothetical protein